MRKHLFIFFASFLLFTVGCEKKKEEITLTKENYSSYFDWDVVGYNGRDSLGAGYSMYISEAMDDTEDYYSYGTVYDRLEIPFCVQSLTDKYTCEDCKFEIKVTGDIKNIYAHINSSKKQTRNINENVIVDVTPDLQVGHFVGKKIKTISSFGSTLNDVNGIYAWDIDWKLVSVSGKLIEK